MEQSDNPVKRLHTIVSSACSPTHARRSTRKVWCAVLGVKRDDRGALLRAFGGLATLIYEARIVVERLDDPNRDYYLTALHTVEQSIPPDAINGMWSPSCVDETTLLTLGMAANVVSGGTAHTPIPEDKLNELLAQTDQLLEQVLSADLPSDELTIFLADQIHSVREAIIMYRIHGTEGLRQAVESALGALLLHREDIDNVDQTTNAWHAVKGFVGLIANICEMLGFGLQLAGAVGWIPQLLPGAN